MTPTIHGTKTTKSATSRPPTVAHLPVLGVGTDQESKGSSLQEIESLSKRFGQIASTMVVPKHEKAPKRPKQQPLCRAQAKPSSRECSQALQMAKRRLISARRATTASAVACASASGSALVAASGPRG